MGKRSRKKKARKRKRQQSEPEALPFPDQGPDPEPIDLPPLSDEGLIVARRIAPLAEIERLRRM